MQNLPAAYLEFHISRKARETYQFDEELYATSGNVVFANVQAARRFAQKMNARRDLQAHPEQAVSAAQINAMGLIDEILHHVVSEYLRTRNPGAMGRALSTLADRLGEPVIEAVLRRFVADFPPRAVQRGQASVDEYLGGVSQRADGSPVSNRELALEELLLLWLENENPAFSPYLELFDDADLERETAYRQVFPVVYEFFSGEPKFGPQNQNLIDMLLAPARAHPTSLMAQLDFLRAAWGELIAALLVRLVGGLDVIREEEKPVFAGPGPALVYEFGGTQYLDEPERFSVDLDWMPNLVLIAKNTYVWLDQLSRKFHRSITRLDQVPDDELLRLRRSGVTGLWLIGLWERSPASQRIKQLRGNPNAVASAYSLFSYDIAADLGGDEAYQKLRDQAWRFGIRLASDMVPNHMGIDSRWVVEHPDWFIQLPYSPFPSYTFNGQNLSWDDRVGLFIEDHYFDNSDAAVVFKRVDFWTGEERFIYHGNDGTSIPWNDTAQLNYLIPEVREAVIQTILHVARKFPVIRFDAAMTLAKKHYQRLWFPEPGTGGAIASRAEAAMTKAHFDEVFPEEFWRMVVDRVAQEAPDTLLLAEAFWLMEGYFVRTLGMHRVYNSAFMNMLRDEKNQEYRLVIKNTLEFDPEILKRYVNFMNNPDERTAVDQFGKGDKYFGVAALLATLPGLPMIGHGQIEGFAEKYGMEFRYPMWHEQPDDALEARHAAEIFPLLRRRYLFAEARDFLLYDFFIPEGGVNEDVFAYSNRVGDEASLVVYHNRFATARGWIHTSAAYAVKTGQGDEKTLVQRSLAHGLGLRDEPGTFTVYRDQISGLEYIRSSAELAQNGWHMTLNAYEYHIYLDFRQVQDGLEGLYDRLASELAGRGVDSVEDALRAMVLEPVLRPYHELVNPGMFDWLIRNRLDAPEFEPANHRMALDETEHKMQALLAALAGKLEAETPAEGPADQTADWPAGEPEPAAETPAPEPEPEAGESAATGTPPQAHVPPKAGILPEAMERIAAQARTETESLLGLSALGRSLAQTPATVAALQYLHQGPAGHAPLKTGEPAVWGVLFGAMAVGRLGSLLEDDARAATQLSLEWLDEWLFGKVLVDTLGGMGVERAAAARSLDLLHVLLAQDGWDRAQAQPQALAESLLRGWLENPAARRYLLVHAYEGVEWFNKEAFEDLAWWTFARMAIRLHTEGAAGEALRRGLTQGYVVVQALLEAAARSGYRVDRLI